MEKNVSRIECDPKCGFAVQSEDEKETLDIAKRHAKEKHNMNATSEQLRSMLTSVKLNVS
jgi:predicted small metal-binding protein